MRIFTCTLIINLCFMPCIVSIAENTPEANEVSTTSMFTPASFEELPKPIVDFLEEHRYLIPDTFRSKTYPDSVFSNNVLKGEFEKKGQTDWAILCARDGYSRILIFLDEKTERVLTLNLAHEFYFRNPNDIKYYGYSIFILKTDKIKLEQALHELILSEEGFTRFKVSYLDKDETDESIWNTLSNLQEYEKISLPDHIVASDFIHAGIEYYYVEKASSIYYLHKGYWYIFPGAD